MVKAFGLVVLALVLSISGLGGRGKTQTGADDVSSDSPTATRPLEVVVSSLARARDSLRWGRVGADAGNEWPTEIRRAVHDLFDVDAVARRALGPLWKGLLPAEQVEFARLFRGVLTQSFVTIVAQHTDDDVASLEEEVDGTFAQVRCRIAPDRGAPVAVEYRLARSGSRWTSYDIVLQGVSLVSNYRSEFTSIIGTGSVAELLDRMRTEQSRRPQFRDRLGQASTVELERPTRERLLAGTVLGTALYARWR